MNSEPKQGQLCRHISAPDNLIIMGEWNHKDMWQPLTRSEILKLAELAPDDGSELPEQVSEAMVCKILSIEFDHDCKRYNPATTADVLRIAKKAGLIKPQTPMQGYIDTPLKDVKLGGLENEQTIEKEEKKQGTVLKTINDLDDPVMSWVFDKRK